MAMTTLKAPILYPEMPNNVSTIPNFLVTAACQLTSATDDVQMIFQAPKSGEIEGVGFRLGDITTGCTLDVRLENVDLATGLSDGTLKDTTTNVSVVVADSDDNTWKNCNFTATATVTKGDYLCLRLDVASGTPSALEIAGYDDGSLLGIGFPYLVENDGSPAAAGAAVLLAVEYATDDYPSISNMWSMSAINATTFNNTDTPDIYANKFKLPFKCRVTGAWAQVDADGDYNMNLYASDGTTVTTTVSVDKDFPLAIVGGSVNNVYFTSTATLEADTYYWLGIEPSSATSMTVYDFEYNSAAIMASSPWGADAALSTAKTPVNTGSWTTSTTKQLACGLIIDQIDYTTGGGQKSHVF